MSEKINFLLLSKLYQLVHSNANYLDYVKTMRICVNDVVFANDNV